MSTGSLPYTPRLKQHAEGLWPIIKETASDWMEDNAMRLSAALALYAILSLAPLLVITTKVISLVWMSNPEKAKTLFNEQLTSLMGHDAATYVATFSRDMRPGAGLLATIISACILLFSATGVFAELQDSMNTIWGVKPKPNQGVWNWVRNRLLSLAMVFGIGFLLLISMFISALMTTASQQLFGRAGWIAHLGEIVLSLGIVTLLFAAIFKFLPDVKLSWRHVWTGAAITAVLFTIGKYGLAVYFKSNPPTSAYGAAGAPVAVLLWIYYSSFILFFGGEFTKVWSLHHGHRVIPDESAVVVTEEDRAQQGIPSERRMRKALSGEPFGQPPASKAPRPGSHVEGRLGPTDYAIAAGSLVVGVIAGGAGAALLRRHGNGVARHGTEDGPRLRDKQCLLAVENGFVNASRIRRVTEDANVKELIDRMEKEVRRLKV